MLKASLAIVGVLLTTSAMYQAQAIQPKDAIKHIVVIFQENVSFDHYFATYPHAVNPSGEPAFTPLPGTPSVEGLSGDLLTKNPNFLNEENGAGRANPFRLRRDQAVTADQDHGYRAEQLAFNNGKMDLFPKSVGHADGPRVPGEKSGVAATSGLTMGYFDGNTVTAYWNYAQHFAMSDHQFDVEFGPSTLGAINLASGQTNGVVNDQNAQGGIVDDGNGGYTLIADPLPSGDFCSSTSDSLVHMTSRNIGDMLTAANVSWGFFQGGFDLTAVNPNGTTGCRRSSKSLAGFYTRDYLPHHEPFQYYKSTANPLHVRPKSVTTIGTNADGTANHQYDAHDFVDAVKAGNFPAIAFLKAPAYEDGHAGYSSPLDEQKFVVEMVNLIQQQPEWKNTVIIIAYDDSDGWYDHLMGPTVNGSESKLDQLNGAGKCGNGSTALGGVDARTKHAYGRCGFGPRLPLLVISPWAKPNYVDHTVTDQTSILRLIEDIFLSGNRIGQGSFDARSGSLNSMLDFSKNKPQNTQPLIVDPETGLVKTKGN
ncbi:phospholipase C [Acidobacterium sp. S8]|uniref:phospholipase C n=1 Tax=Acidobacterium sp. S8 TaxID=1641854 RepID=UPI0020B149B3|nr:alkaline phosphatase family protein [Acidobacterium sp. S8]